MEKIAIISDIHGNLPAIEAVLKDIRMRSANKIVCLGDIVGKGPNSAEAIDICKRECDIIVLGNWDKYLAYNNNHGIIEWHRKQIGKERLEYFKSLPEAVGFYLSGRYVRLFHAHPHDVFKRVWQSSSIEERKEMFEVPKINSKDSHKCKSDIVGYGDIHGSFIETLSGGKILFNVGSVGNPCDHITLASYVILEGDFDSKKISSFSIQFQRVEYDIKLAIDQAKKSSLPMSEIYIKELSTAVYGGKRR
ncbi:metallophosphoesterase family protein [Maledivibacter halophilus]|uniref:Protein phosphatase n=1 Tax=Maledivibacter halophilus TaxID=36842 RepID=A0A1T5MAK1_9FIRM|nr:metallophosphoesterase family protein [Maledivibacter halophilus]SKC84889.1 protein phosphatase [Maledivibacter halophilus]